jgi:hypothetical protein
VTAPWRILPDNVKQTLWKWPPIVVGGAIGFLMAVTLCTLICQMVLFYLYREDIIIILKSISIPLNLTNKDSTPNKFYSSWKTGGYSPFQYEYFCKAWQ